MKKDRGGGRPYVCLIHTAKRWVFFRTFLPYFLERNAEVVCSGVRVLEYIYGFI